MNLADLIAKAEKVSPRVNTSRNEWRKLFPVVEKLMGNGFNIISAVRWLVEQKAINAKDENRAYQALRLIAKRREKK